MIFLKPEGGLCNRMRTIDSVISLCIKYKRDLTVLWVKDTSLNCPFDEIFEKIECKDLNITIIDCPVGFPENYPDLLNYHHYNSSFGKSLIRYLKNVYKFRFITKKHKAIRNQINAINSNCRIKNDELKRMYSSERHVAVKTAREMDEIFIAQVQPLIHELFRESSANVYITSCYRLYPMENNYQVFRPLQFLKYKINGTTSNFRNTFGLHIRRSDHVTSKNYSTTHKFMELVESLLNKDSNTTFFLSTDDTKTKNELISKFGKSILFNEIISYDRNSANAVKDAILDLYCLAATKTVYGSHHSSFSQTAADIGMIKEVTVK